MLLDEAARRIGGFCWVERRLFEVLGGWVPALSAVEAKLALDRHSQHAAWRAGQWWDRLPVLADVDRDALVVAPDPSWDAVTAALAHLATDVARLAGGYRVVVARVSSAYRAFADSAQPVSDGPALWALRMVGDDLGRDWAEGEAILQGLLGTEADVGEAAGVVAGLESLFAAD